MAWLLLLRHGFTLPSKTSFSASITPFSLVFVFFSLFLFMSLMKLWYYQVVKCGFQLKTEKRNWSPIKRMTSIQSNSRAFLFCCCLFSSPFGFFSYSLSAAHSCSTKWMKAIFMLRRYILREYIEFGYFNIYSLCSFIYVSVRALYLYLPFAMFQFNFRCECILMSIYLH